MYSVGVLKVFVHACQAKMAEKISRLLSCAAGFMMPRDANEDIFHLNAGQMV
jgi:hypothetical protein